jgi:hypothetical protein
LKAQSGGMERGSSTPEATLNLGLPMGFKLGLEILMPLLLRMESISPLLVFIIVLNQQSTWEMMHVIAKMKLWQARQLLPHLWNLAQGAMEGVHVPWDHHHTGRKSTLALWEGREVLRLLNEPESNCPGLIPTPPFWPCQYRKTTGSRLGLPSWALSKSPVYKS